MIKVTDRFYINANSNCYSLQEKTTIQDTKSENYGKEIFKDLGYYTSLEGCLRGILKITAREYVSKDEENTIKDLQKKLKEMDEFIKSLKLDV